MYFWDDITTALHDLQVNKNEGMISDSEAIDGLIEIVAALADKTEEELGDKANYNHCHDENED